jgi:hypothetical protein
MLGLLGLTSLLKAEVQPIPIGTAAITTKSSTAISVSAQSNTLSAKVGIDNALKIERMDPKDYLSPLVITFNTPTRGICKLVYHGSFEQHYYSVGTKNEILEDNKGDNFGDSTIFDGCALPDHSGFIVWKRTQGYESASGLNEITFFTITDVPETTAQKLVTMKDPSIGATADSLCWSEDGKYMVRVTYTSGCNIYDEGGEPDSTCRVRLDYFDWVTYPSRETNGGTWVDPFVQTKLLTLDEFKAVKLLDTNYWNNKKMPDGI